MKQKKKGMAPVLLLIFMILTVGMLTGDILGDDMVTVKVEDYVCKTCTVSSSWTSDKYFEQRIMFDYKIDYSISGNDAVLYLLDANRNKIELYKAPNVYTCDDSTWGGDISTFSYPKETYIITILPNTAELRTIDGILIKTISIINKQGPYNLHVNVISQRGTNCVGGTGASLKFGIINIGNIAILDIEPEPIITPEPEPIITPEPGLITDPVTSPIDDIIDDIKDIFEPTPEDDIIIPDGKEYLDYVYQEPADVPELYVEPTFMNKISNIITGLKLWISLNIGL